MSDTFALDTKPVPRSSKPNGYAEKIRATFEKMQPGQSFFVPTKGINPAVGKGALIAASEIGADGKPVKGPDGKPKLRFKFECKAVREGNDTKGYRIWYDGPADSRVAPEDGPAKEAAVGNGAAAAEAVAPA